MEDQISPELDKAIRNAVSVEQFNNYQIEQLNQSIEEEAEQVEEIANTDQPDIKKVNQVNEVIDEKDEEQKGIFYATIAGIILAFILKRSPDTDLDDPATKAQVDMVIGNITTSVLDHVLIANGGMTIKELVNRYHVAKRKAILNYILTFLKGESDIKKLIKRLKRDAKSVNTTLANATNNYSQEYDDVISGDLPEYERYVAVLDDRTTELCRSLHGKVFVYKEGPIPPLHINCRSKRVRFNNTDAGAHDLAIQSYNDWLGIQSDEYRIEVIGETNNQNFIAGKVTFPRLFVQSSITSEELRSKLL